MNFLDVVRLHRLNMHLLHSRAITCNFTIRTRELFVDLGVAWWKRNGKLKYTTINKIDSKPIFRQWHLSD